jgi:hypothetical protein
MCLRRRDSCASGFRGSIWFFANAIFEISFYAPGSALRLTSINCMMPMANLQFDDRVCATLQSSHAIDARGRTDGFGSSPSQAHWLMGLEIKPVFIALPDHPIDGIRLCDDLFAYPH